jgi:hypothetical protein
MATTTADFGYVLGMLIPNSSIFEPMQEDNVIIYRCSNMKVEHASPHKPNQQHSMISTQQFGAPTARQHTHN